MALNYVLTKRAAVFAMVLMVWNEL